MRKSVSINPDGSIVIPKEIVEEVFGKSKEAVIHIRSHSITLSPIYIDLNSGEIPNILQEYFEDEKLSSILKTNFHKTSMGGVQFEGDLSVLSLSDVLLFLSASKKTGCLLIEAESPWGVFFEDGHIVLITSEDYRFSLAGRLLRRQFVTEQDLVEGIRKGENKKGIDILFEISGLTKEEFNHERILAIEDSLYHLFEIREGRFSFQNGTLDKEVSIPLPLSTTNYVMEAMRRLDEFSRIQSQLPQMDAILEISEDVTASAKLSVEEETILASVNGKRTAEEVIANSRLSEMEAKKAIVSLLLAGMIKVEKAKEEIKEVIGLDKEEVEKYNTIIASYNSVFCNIYQALSVESGSKTKVILSPFFKGLEKGSSILYGLSLEEDGSIDPNKILQNLILFEKGKRQEILIRDLNELLYFQLFAVKNSLGPELEQGIVEMAKTLLSGNEGNK